MQNIQKILEELYQIDNSLKQNEVELKKIIEKMIEIKPNIKIDENFKNQLKNQIENQIIKQKVSNISQEKNNFSKIFIYFLGGVSVGAFSFFMINQAFLEKQNINLDKNSLVNETLKVENKSLNENKTPKTTTQETNSQNKENITKNEEIPEISQEITPTKIQSQTENTNSQLKNTLKKLSQNKQEKQAENQNFNKDENKKIEETRNMTLKEINPSFVSLENTPVGKMSGDMMSPYIGQIYTYSFSGDLNNLKIENNLPEYKLQDTKINGDIFGKDKIGIDLSKFENLNISTINLSQDNEYGLNISIDFDNGNISMWQNYGKWPENQKDTKINELTDQKAIEIAQEFIKKYQIDISNYNSPEIIKPQEDIVYNSENTNIYAGEAQQKTVLYQLNIDGNEVFEEYGEKIGIKITIDNNSQKITGVSGINIGKYQKEKTDIETNKENILKSALNGGKSGFIENNSPNQEVKYLNLELQNPIIKYFPIYKTKDNKTIKYFVPAIFFEVKENSDPYSPKRIIVPLNKDFYKYDENGKIIGIN